MLLEGKREMQSLQGLDMATFFHHHMIYHQYKNCLYFHLLAAIFILTIQDIYLKQVHMYQALSTINLSILPPQLHMVVTMLPYPRLLTILATEF